MKPLTYAACAERAVLVDAVDHLAGKREFSFLALLGRDLCLDIAGLESYFCNGKWSPVLFDLFVVAGAAEFCDFVARRPSLGWSRMFDLRVAVHDPALWNRPAVKAALIDALHFLTGDSWAIEFVARAAPQAPIVEQSLLFGSDINIVVPYSDGLDSRAAATLACAETNARIVRVRLGSARMDQKAHNAERLAFTAVPYKIVLPQRRRKESSARSRGFKFAIITGIAAQLADAEKVIVTESGQGALGPVLTVSSAQAYPDYRVHPAFTMRIERLFQALTGSSPRYIFPRLWSTKGQTLAAAEAVKPQPWSKTRSCWQGARQVGVDNELKQCGACAACLLRRMSMHAAGLLEPPGTYIWDLRAKAIEDAAPSDSRVATLAARQYAIAGVLHLDHLAALPVSSRHQGAIRRVVREIASAIGEDVAETEKNLLSMLNQHRREWIAFVESLGPQSFVAKLADVSS